jgi:hypothetical protein
MSVCKTVTVYCIYKHKYTLYEAEYNPLILDQEIIKLHAYSRQFIAKLKSTDW